MQYLEFEQPIADLEQKIKELSELNIADDKVLTPEIKRLKKRVEELRESIFTNLTRWQRVQLARHPDRPYTLDYIYKITEHFTELHGDRYHSDDKAIVGGLATIDGQSVMIMGHQKGRDTKGRQYRNFGMANPEGYRKAYRLMKLAEKFNIPIITLLDTPGAYPGLEAEERGQAEAIAKNLKMMATLKVPLVTVVIGEGASGGAIGIGMGNEVYMMENTWYSVISPESCSSILWKTWDYKEQAAAVLKLTAEDLKELKIIDGIVKEPLGGAHRDPDAAAESVKQQILESLKRLKKQKPEKLVENRINKYASMGEWHEKAKTKSASGTKTKSKAKKN
jgi:acetyl-CoA carboxylase carboxyl transferase subunit alpha